MTHRRMGTPGDPLQGKVCIVTGATRGIGESTARELARRGGQLLLVGRSASRCESTIARFRADGVTTPVEYAVADLSRMSEVRRLAETIQSGHRAVHVLVNNAGAVYAKRQVTPEGNELTFALNVLSPFLLTRLLEPELTRGQPSRVVMVDSEAHRRARLDLDDLDGARTYRGFRAYCQSKLALLLLTYELSRRWNEKRIGVNAVHPGFVRSGYGKNNPGFFGWGIAFAELLGGISPERGSRTVVYAASDPHVEGISGTYFSHMRPVRTSPSSYDLTTARRLWDVASQRAGLSD